MRLIPSPKAYCSVNNKPLRDQIFWTGDEHSRLDGPFNSKSELNDALMKICFRSGHLQGKAEFLRRDLPSILNGHSAVLTYGDLQRKNIMIRIESNSFSSTFLDREVAGWYPSRWDRGFVGSQRPNREKQTQGRI